MMLTIYIRPGRTENAVQAYCPDLLGCSAVGETEEEAVSLVRARVEAYFSERNQKPAPAGIRRVEIEL